MSMNESNSDIDNDNDIANDIDYNIDNDDNNDSRSKNDNDEEFGVYNVTLQLDYLPITKVKASKLQLDHIHVS